MSDLTATVREPGEGGVDIGDSTTGVVQAIGLDGPYTGDDGDEYHYVKVEIDHDDVPWEDTAGYNFDVAESTGLGQLLERFGADLTVGDDVDIKEHVSVGTEVAYRLGQGNQKDDGSYFTDIDPSTVVKAGDDVPQLSEAYAPDGHVEDDSDSSSGSQEDASPSPDYTELFEVLEEVCPAPTDKVVNTIATHENSGTLYPQWQEHGTDLDGVTEDENGMVTVE